MATYSLLLKMNDFVVNPKFAVYEFTLDFSLIHKENQKDY